MYQSWTEWKHAKDQLVLENQLDQGIVELISNAKSNETPPPAQNIEQKKSWIRQFWDNHKGKIVIGALGAAAIAALYMSGISLPGLGGAALRLGRGALGVADAADAGVASASILDRIAGKPVTALLSDYKKVFVKNDLGNWTPVSYEELAKLAQSANPGSNGFKIRLLRAADSRVSNEIQAMSVLKQFGLSDADILVPHDVWKGN